MSVTNVSGGSMDSKKYIDDLLTNIVYQVDVPCIMSINGTDHEATLSFQGLKIGEEYLPLHGAVHWWTVDENEWITIPANSSRRFLVQIKGLGKYAMLVPAWHWDMNILNDSATAWAGNQVRVEFLGGTTANYPTGGTVSCEHVVYNTGNAPIKLAYGMTLCF